MAIYLEQKGIYLVRSYLANKVCLKTLYDPILKAKHAIKGAKNFESYEGIVSPLSSRDLQSTKRSIR